MDALVSEAVSELSRLGLTDLLKKNPLRCELRLSSEEGGILVCPALVQLCCPCLPLFESVKWSEIMHFDTFCIPNWKISAYKSIFQFIHKGTLDMSLLLVLKDTVEFAIMASTYLVMPTLKKLCQRVLELRVTPTNIWNVLSDLGSATHLYYLCNKVFTLQTIECLEHLGRMTVSANSLHHFICLHEMNIDSEIQLIHAFQRIKSYNPGFWRKRLPDVANNFRFMTLSKAELASIIPFLREILTAENLEAVVLAVTSGDSSKLPSHFSKSCTKRKPPVSDMEYEQSVGQNKKRKRVKNDSVGPAKKKSCLPNATSEQVDQSVLQTEQLTTHLMLGRCLMLPLDVDQLAEMVKFEPSSGQRKVSPSKRVQREMNNLEAEAKSELFRLGLFDHKYAALCKLNFSDASALVCELVMQTCCPQLSVSDFKVWPHELSMKMRSINMNAFKNIIEFTHKGTLDLCLLNTLDDYLEFVLLANRWIVVPELLRLSRRVLQLHVQPSNVWYLLSRLQHNPHLAAICDEVLTNRTRECLQTLQRANLSERMLLHFLSLNQMHISTEAELLSGLLKFERRNGNCDNLTAAFCCLRFMSFRKDDLPLFEDQLKRLLPGYAEAVILAIESGDSSKLPQMFETRSRYLTASEYDQSALEIQIEDSPLPDLKEINKLVSAAAQKLAPLGIQRYSNDVCMLVVGREKEEMETNPHLFETCAKEIRMKPGQIRFFPHIKPNCMKAFLTFVRTGNLDMSLLRTVNDFVDFAVAIQKMQMPLMMKLSADLLELLIRPRNVWPVLHKISPFSHLRGVCDQVLCFQTLDCLQFMDEDDCHDSLQYLLKQNMACIESEVQFVQAIQKFQFTDDEKRHRVMHQLFQNLRFMTLSMAELDSIKPFLQENLLYGDLVAVRLAVVSGDSSKLPQGFSNSTLKRNNTLTSLTHPSRKTVAVSLNPPLEMQTIAVEQGRSLAPASTIDVQVKCEPADDEQPMNCADLVGQVDIKMERSKIEEPALVDEESW